MNSTKNTVMDANTCETWEYINTYLGLKMVAIGVDWTNDEDDLDGQEYIGIHNDSGGYTFNGIRLVLMLTKP
jgi:hypothetical protein